MFKQMMKILLLLVLVLGADGAIQKNY